MWMRYIWSSPRPLAPQWNHVQDFLQLSGSGAWYSITVHYFIKSQSEMLSRRSGDIIGSIYIWLWHPTSGWQSGFGWHIPDMPTHPGRVTSRLGWFTRLRVGWSLVGWPPPPPPRQNEHILCIWKFKINIGYRQLIQYSIFYPASVTIYIRVKITLFQGGSNFSRGVVFRYITRKMWN